MEKTRTLTSWVGMNLYGRFQSLSVPQKVLVALGAAALTGILAQIRVPLPFTPVPLTLQVMGVVGTGLLLGSLWGAISMALYAIIGAMGMPWFTGMSGGIHHILGPTGGYIVGFIVGAYIAGLLAEKMGRLSGPFFGSLAAILSIYTFGVLGLMLYGMDIKTAIVAGVLPFVVADLLKALIAGGFCAVAR